MYTPTALSVINSLYPSVNVIDQDNYDISMSSAVGVNRRFTDSNIATVCKSPRRKQTNVCSDD